MNDTITKTELSSSDIALTLENRQRMYQVRATNATLASRLSVRIQDISKNARKAMTEHEKETRKMAVEFSKFQIGYGPRGRRKSDQIVLGAETSRRVQEIREETLRRRQSCHSVLSQNRADLNRNLRENTKISRRKSVTQTLADVNRNAHDKSKKSRRRSQSQPGRSKSK